MNNVQLTNKWIDELLAQEYAKECRQTAPRVIRAVIMANPTLDTNRVR